MEIIQEKKITIQEALKKLEQFINQNAIVDSDDIIAKKSLNGVQLFINTDIGNISNKGNIIRWAKIKTVIDANNYTADIYENRDEAAIETDVTIKVFDILDELEVDTWIPVIKYPHSDEIYWTCSQQIGVI